MNEENEQLENETAGETFDDVSSPDDSDASFDSAIESVADENDAANEPTPSEELANVKDENLKLLAELDNVRKRVRREADDRVKYANLPLVADLLQVLDNLKRGIDAAKQSDNAGGLVEGVEMVLKQFGDTLGKHNCTPIAAVGEEFDPNIHEAISQMPSEEVAAGHVLMEATQGYQLHDRVVRPSQVIVSTGKAEG